MGIILFLVFGLVVGFIARAIMPGTQKMGMLATMLLGVVGSFIGGIVGNLISGGPLLELQTAGFIGSIIGALLVLFVMGFAGRRSVRSYV